MRYPNSGPTPLIKQIGRGPGSHPAMQQRLHPGALFLGTRTTSAHGIWTPCAHEVLEKPLNFLPEISPEVEYGYQARIYDGQRSAGRLRIRSVHPGPIPEAIAQ